MSNFAIETIIHDMVIERLTPVAEIVSNLVEKGAGFDAEQLEPMVRDIVDQMGAQKVEIVLRDLNGAEKKVKGEHPEMPYALMMLQQPRIQDCNIVIWGEKSSGKTTMAEKIAAALDLDYYYSGAALTKFDLLGYQLPNGDTISTPFMEAWTKGGLFLLDDADRSNPQAISMINMALANGKCDFSNAGIGMQERHKDCYIVFTANTPMTGGNAQYSTAAKIDGATRDRFTFIEVNIDEKHELKITPNTDWTKRIQNLRKQVKKIGGNIENIVDATMRSSFLGATLLKAGMTQERVEEACVFKGAGKDVKTQVYSLAGEPAKKKGELVI
jgi:hypothetical protein